MMCRVATVDLEVVDPTKSFTQLSAPPTVSWPIDAGPLLEQFT